MCAITIEDYIATIIKNLDDKYKFVISTKSFAITKQTIPHSVKYIQIVCSYTQRINPNILPTELLGVDLGHFYNNKLEKDVLPKKLSYLLMSDLYEHKFDMNTFPPNLICLRLPSKYRQKINGHTLPNSIQYLELPEWNNCEIPQPLPSNLTHLYLGGDYTYSFKNIILPSKLYLIKFKCGIDCVINESCFPESLKVMVFYNDEHDIGNENIWNNTPPSVETLILYYITTKITNLPPTIKKIKILYSYKKKHIKKYITKIPFGCIIVDKNDNIIMDSESE